MAVNRGRYLSPNQEVPSYLSEPAQISTSPKNFSTEIHTTLFLSLTFKHFEKADAHPFRRQQQPFTMAPQAVSTYDIPDPFP